MSNNGHINFGSISLGRVGPENIKVPYHYVFKSIFHKDNITMHMKTKMVLFFNINYIKSILI